MEPQHLDTFAASCALAAVLKDAGNIEAHMEGFGDLRVFWSFRSDFGVSWQYQDPYSCKMAWNLCTRMMIPMLWQALSVIRCGIAVLSCPVSLCSMHFNSYSWAGSRRALQECADRWGWQSLMCRSSARSILTTSNSHGSAAGYEKLDPYHAETLTTATALALLRQGNGKPHKAEESLIVSCWLWLRRNMD